MTDTAAPVEVDEASIGVSLEEVRAEMDPLGLAKWEAAYSAALTKKLAGRLQDAMERIAVLEAQRPAAATPPADA